MADTTLYVQAQPFQLYGAGAVAGATTITLVTFNDITGTALTLADFGTKGYGTLEPGSGTQEESITFSGVTANANGTTTLTGVKSTLTKAPYTETSGLSTSHAGGTNFVISNTAAFYNALDAKGNDETITGTYTFTSPNIPRSTSATEIATAAEQYITKYFFDTNGGSTPSLNNRIVVGAIAGETVASGKLVYLKTSDGRWWLADADAASSSENVQLGIAQGAGTAGVAFSTGVMTLGFDTTTQSGLTTNTVYYVSNTAGEISTTPGTKEVVVGMSQAATELYFFPQFNQQITEDEQDALAGTSGTPTASNKYVTNNDVTNGIDQSQTTRDGTKPVGTADTTGLDRKLAQSFTAGFTSSIGVQLNKQADTGSFTGTVTVTLEADSSGSPSGTALATVTMNNADWLLINAGPATFMWSTAYTALTPGTTYWYVITTSTADTSNCINVGTNTAGGYSGGLVKLFNTTDGWTLIATIDLTFKGLTTQALKATRADSTGTQQAQLPYAVDTGSTDAYQIQIITDDITWVDGREYVWKAATANTGTATLNPNSWGPKTLKKYGASTSLDTGDILANQILVGVYNSTSDVVQITSQLATVGPQSVARISSGSVTSVNVTVAAGEVACPLFSDETFDLLGEMNNGYQAVTCTAGTGATTVVASGATFTSADVGRYWWNNTRQLFALITTFNSSTNITVDSVAGQVSTDTGWVYSGKFTAAATGYYQVNVNVPIVVTGATAINKMSLFKNGSVYSRHYSTQSGANTGTNWYTPFVINDIVQLNATDYLQIFLDSDSATTQWGLSVGGTSSWFSVKRVS